METTQRTHGTDAFAGHPAGAKEHAMPHTVIARLKHGRPVVVVAVAHGSGPTQQSGLAEHARMSHGRALGALPASGVFVAALFPSPEEEGPGKEGADGDKDADDDCGSGPGGEAFALE